MTENWQWEVTQTILFSQLVDVILQINFENWENKAFINWTPTVSCPLDCQKQLSAQVQKCLCFILQLLSSLLACEINISICWGQWWRWRGWSLQGERLCSPVCTAIAGDGACRANGQYPSADHRHNWTLAPPPLNFVEGWQGVGDVHFS